MNKVIKKVPVPIAGLMLALAASGNLVLSYGAKYRNIFGVLSALVLLLILFKLFIDSKDVIESLNNPVVASVSPTISMGLMLLSTYIKPYSAKLAFEIWIFAILLHCVLMVYFTIKFIFNFDIKKIFPSYFIVYVGLVVVSVTAPTYNMTNLGRAAFWFGLIAYICLLPIVIYRVLAIRSIAKPASPTLVIFAAPASLCLVGYLASFQQKNISMVVFLGVLSLLMFLVALAYLPSLLKLKFYPSYSSFTFPFVISGIAMKQTNVFLTNIHEPIHRLVYLVKFQEIFAISIVTYVLIRYIKFLFVEDNIYKNDNINKAM